MIDVLCSVCGHSINLHQAQGCYKRRDAKDKMPGSFCVCKQTAADIAVHEVEMVKREFSKSEKAVEHPLHPTGGTASENSREEQTPSG